MISLSNTQKFGLGINKLVGIGVAAYAVIEAIFAYFFVFQPMYINPVYRMCEEYNSNGTTCMVALFGKTFASKAEIANNQIILSLWDTVFNVIIIYILTTGITLLLAFCMFKGMSFAKSYFIAFFGAKHILGMVTIVIPFANISTETSVFGIVVAAVSLALCVLFMQLSNEEYADDMVYTDQQTKEMAGRMKLSLILYGIFLVFIVGLKMGMSALGNYWSLYLGWLDNTAIGQGWTLAILLSVALIAAVMYVREADWAMYFFGSFGVVSAVCGVLALALRFTSADRKTSAWWVATVMLIVAIVAAAAMTFLSFKKVMKKIQFKFVPEDKKPALAVLISAGSIVLSFVLTIAAVTVWHKMIYAGAALGAMDYMYFILYGGITLFLAVSMMGGYTFTKFGTLGLYLIVASNNFISIFAVFSQRSAAIAAGTVTTGSNYIIAGVLFILSLVACFGILPVFITKGVADYQYEKRYC